MDRRSFLLGGGVLGLAACAKPERDLLASTNIDAIKLQPAASAGTISTSSGAPSTTSADGSEAVPQASPDSLYPVVVPEADLPGIEFVVNALLPTTNVSATRGGPTQWTFDNPIESGGPLVFLMDLDSFTDNEFYRVLLPVRPNGSFGWVNANDVSLTRHNYRLKIELDAYRLTLSDHSNVIFTTDIGVARNNTPTPQGIYYTTELLHPTIPNSVYGVYAYGLSGYSDTFTEFNGGPGQLGIHGTNDPSTIGTNVSHGCIRMRNSDITVLVEEIGLPVGVPVDVV